MKPNRPEPKKYSPEVEKILNRRSGFIVRNGILFVTIFFTLLLVVSSFIKYPEQLKASITFSQGSILETDEMRGEIIVTADAASLVKPGQPVSIFLYREDENQSEQFIGEVSEIESVGSGTYYKIYVTSLPENIPSGIEGTAIIETSEISLLYKILDPIFAIFNYD